MFYITVSNGLLRDEHRKRMGAAVWEFMWLLDKITKIDDEGYGWVLGGKPIKREELVTDMKVNIQTISRNLILLEKEGYILRTRTPYGVVIKVVHAKKNFGKRGDINVSSEDKRDETFMSHLTNENVSSPNENVSSNKTIQMTIHKTLDTDVATQALQEGDVPRIINHFIGAFKEINPSYRQLFKNKNQRAAMERMIKTHGAEKMEKLLLSLPGIVSRKYAPRITTPVQLENKFGELGIFIQQERSGLPTVAKIR